MYSVEEFSLEATWEFERLRFDALAGAYFTRRFAWLSAWWRGYQQSNMRLRILKVIKFDQTVAYLPLYINTDNNSLHLLGSGKACSDDVGLYALQGHEQRAAQAIAKYLYDTGLQGEWDFLHLEGVRNNCVAMNCLLLEMRKTFGSSFNEMIDQPCRVIKLHGSYDNYFTNAVAHSQRSKLRREVRNHLDSGRATFETAETFAQAQDHLQAVTKLHQMRWVSKGEDGCAADHRFQMHLSDACQRLFEDKMWFSNVLYIDGKMAAGAIGAQNRSHVSIYMTGMDPSITEVRPGILMNLAAIRYACQKGCSYYDLMRGDEPYKSRLGATAVAQYVWTASAPRLLPRILGRVESTKHSLKNWYKQYRTEQQQNAN